MNASRAGTRWSFGSTSCFRILVTSNNYSCTFLSRSRVLLSPFALVIVVPPIPLVYLNKECCTALSTSSVLGDRGAVGVSLIDCFFLLPAISRNFFFHFITSAFRSSTCLFLSVMAHSSSSTFSLAASKSFYNNHASLILCRNDRSLVLWVDTSSISTLLSKLGRSDG